MEPFIGQIIMFGGNFAPRGWALCDGQLLAISSNQALFSILGTTYGGDGRTSFGLPEMRGRVAVHEGTGPGLGPYQLGQRGGFEQVTLNQTQMPIHTHGAAVTTTTNMLAESRAGNTTDPAGNMLAAGSNIFRANARADDVAMDPAMLDVNVQVQNQNAGGSQPHENRQPYTVVNYIIALVGVFPSRN